MSPSEAEMASFVRITVREYLQSCVERSPLLLSRWSHGAGHLLRRR